MGLAEAAVTLQKVSAFRDPRLYALNVFADQFSKSVQPLVPSRLFISNAGSTAGEARGGKCSRTLLNLILSEKAGSTSRKYRQLEADGGFYQAIHRQRLSWQRRPVEEGDSCYREGGSSDELEN